MSKQVVESIKADLVARGVDLSGAVGAAQITVRVAYTLRDRFGLLLKKAGNRAVFRADGTCVDGDHANAGEPGFATDYLIDRATFFGYDILQDGGGLNGPQWPDDPETTEVARNKANFAEAPNLDGAIDPPGPIDPPVDPPVPPVEPLPPALGELVQAFAELKQAVLEQHILLNAINAKLSQPIVLPPIVFPNYRNRYIGAIEKA